MTPGATPQAIARIMAQALQWAIRTAPPGSSPTVVMEVLRRDAERAAGDEEAALVRMVLQEDEAEVRRAIAILQQPREQEYYPMALGRHVWSQRAGQWVPCRELDQIVTVTWRELVRGMSRPRKVQGDKLQAPWWIPATFGAEVGRNGRPVRTDANVLSVWALVCDLDSGQPVYQCIEAVRQSGRRAMVHTTWSHSADNHKARVIFPLSEPCPAAEWGGVWLSGALWASRLGLQVDPKCKNPGRLYFLPALPAGRSWAEKCGLFVAQAIEGEPLDWRALQAECPPPTPVEPPRSRPVSLGLPQQALDAETRRRRAYALGIIRHRAVGLVAQGQGSRNQTLYTAGRAASQLAQAGALDLDEARAILTDAAEQAGLTRSEAARALENGITKGMQDPPWDQW